jgi:L-amino acid N-acyltransferase YncA
LEVWLEAEGIKVWAALIDSPNQESIAFFTKSGYLHDPGVEYFSKRRGSGA